MSYISLKNNDPDKFLNNVRSNPMNLVATPNGVQILPTPAPPMSPIQAEIFEDNAAYPTIIVDDATGDDTFTSEYGWLKITKRAGVTTPLLDLINQYVTFNREYENIEVSIKKPQSAELVMELNAGPSVSSYSVSPKFNFSSRAYNNSQAVYQELQIPLALPTEHVVRRSDFTEPPYPYILGAPTYNQYKKVSYSGTDFGDSRTMVSEFPYYTQLTITDRTRRIFTDAIKILEISKQFLNGYLALPKTEHSYYYQNGGASADERIIPSLNLSQITEPSNNQGQIDFYDTADDMFYMEDPETGQILSGLQLNMRKQLLAEAVRTIASGDNFRKMSDLLNGKRCYHENYTHQFTKYSGDTVAGTPIQDFFISAINDITVLNDAQVKYKNMYTYANTGHYVVVGNVYSFKSSSLVAIDPQNPEDGYRIAFMNRPIVRIIPIPIFDTTVAIVQPPPILPKVNFSTLMDSTRKVDIHLSPTQGHLYDDFHMILPRDQDQMALMVANRPFDQTQDGFRFETFNEPGLYEVFRTDVPPRTLLDFAEKKVAEISMPFVTPTAIYSDFIQPHKKYYYLFRKVNIEGFVSNPTAVFEVELIIDADDSRVLVEEYKLPEPNISRDYHQFQSLFQVQPAAQQRLFDSTQDALFQSPTYRGKLDDLKLGTAQDLIWGRRMKFRIRSTISGKLIDYNIRFKLTKEKTEEDF